MDALEDKGGVPLAGVGVQSFVSGGKDVSSFGGVNGEVGRGHRDLLLWLTRPSALGFENLDLIDGNSGGFGDVWERLT